MLRTDPLDRISLCPEKIPLALCSTEDESAAFYFREGRYGGRLENATKNGARLEWTEGVSGSMPTNPSAALWSAGVLLMIFTLKHFLADFLFQTEWMARGKEQVSGWQGPLASHVAIHAVMTLTIALAFAPVLWWLALVDLCVHAFIDRGKALIALRCDLTVTQSQFWWLIGFDQALHQATNVALTGALLML